MTIDSVSQLASRIAELEPGPVAALRRGFHSAAGAAAFWSLLSQINFDPACSEENKALLIQAIAILTPRGSNPDKRSAHDPSLPMGTALYKAKPKVNELRLSRLLTARGRMRQDLAIRLCRRLSRSEYSRFDLGTLKQFMLYPADDKGYAARQIAQGYYRAEAAENRASATNTDESKEDNHV